VRRSGGYWIRKYGYVVNIDMKMSDLRNHPNIGNVYYANGYLVEDNDTKSNMSVGKLKAGALKLKQFLDDERSNTSKMIDIYIRASKKQAEATEIYAANKQFKELLKIVGLGIFITIPIPGTTLLLFVIEKFMNRYSISILPDTVKALLSK
jgi:hypothetical protein